MATVPSVYQNNNPITEAQLSPLQLALAAYMAQGTPLAFGPNQRFANAMNVFTDSVPLKPLAVDPRTGLSRVPDISKDLVGLNYQAKGDDIYLYRRAQDCGPDENRYEYVWVAKRSQLGFLTWLYYATRVPGGSIADANANPGDFGGTYDGAGNPGNE
jgi:hypothetical protein